MVKTLIRWLAASGKLANKWYVDDDTLVTNSVEDMVSLLAIVQHFSTWSGIHLNVAKSKITAYIHELQYIPKRKDRDDALRARLAHVTLACHPIGALIQDETLPGGYLGTSLTPSLSPEAHLLWIKSHIIRGARANSPTPTHQATPSTLWRAL